MIEREWGSYGGINIVRKPDSDGVLRLKGIRVALKRPNVTRDGQLIHVGSVATTLPDYQRWIDDSPLSTTVARATLVLRVFLAGPSRQSTVLSPGPVRAAVTNDDAQTVLIQPTMLSDDIHTVFIVADTQDGADVVKVVKNCKDDPNDPPEGVLGTISEFDPGKAPAAATLDGGGILIDGLQLQNATDMQFIYADVVVCGRGSTNPDLTSPPFMLSNADKQRSLTGEPLRVRTGAIDCSQGCPVGSPCVDGFCCAGPCAGACEACSMAAGATEDGICNVVSAGSFCRPTPNACAIAPVCDGARRDCPAGPGTGETCNLRDDDCDGDIDNNCQWADPLSCQGDAALCPPVDLTVDFGTASSRYSTDGTYSPEHGATPGDVGSLPGGFAVTPYGAASYSMPLAVPPGRAGVQPALSLEYNSERGNGPLGVGWAVAGLSEIRRCPKTYVQDGESSDVKLDSSDGLCLDGVRLLSAPLQGYACPYLGTVGTSLLPERNPFTKVCGYNWLSQNGAYFVAWTKDGRRLEYGYAPGTTADIGRGNGTYATFAWGLSRVEDRRGNFMTIEYASDAASAGAMLPNGVMMKRWLRPAAEAARVLSPARILYTGYSGTAGPALVPQRSVEFDYGLPSETRLDVIKTYYRGQEFVQSKLLRRIRTYGPGHRAISTYFLQYDEAAPPAYGRSRLTSVQRCAGQGVAGDACIPATQFYWSERHPIEFTASPGWLPKVKGPFFGLEVPSSYGAFLGELDGDGQSELAVFASPADGGSWIVDNLGAVAATASSVVASELPVKYPIDLDNDALTDFVETTAPSFPAVGTSYLRAVDGALLEDVTSWQLQGNATTADGIPTAFPGDFDGDGATDVLLVYERGDGVLGFRFVNPSNGWELTDTGLCWKQSSGDSDYGWTALHRQFDVQDYDGDGRAEFVYGVWDGVSVRLMAVELAGTAWTERSYQLTNPESGNLFAISWQWLDANGDGLRDVVVDAAHGAPFEADSSSTYLYVNTGDGFVANARVRSTAGALFDACPGVGGYLTGTRLRMSAVGDFDTDGGEELISYAPDEDPRLGHFVVYRFDVGRASVDCSLLGTGYWAEPLAGASFPVLAPIIQVGHVTADAFPDLVVGDALGWTVKWATGEAADRIVAIRTGINPTAGREKPVPRPSIEITYGVTTSPEVYADGNTAGELAACVENHVVCTTPSLVVVTHVADWEPTPVVVRTYKYEQARFHRLGRGWLGFGRIQTADALPGPSLAVATTSTYDLLSYDWRARDFVLRGTPTQVTSITPAAEGMPSVVDEVEVIATPPVYVGTGPQVPYFVYARSTKHRRWEGTLDEAAKTYSTETVDTTEDDFGNVTWQSRKVQTEPASDYTVPGYTAGAYGWLARLLAAESAGTLAEVSQTFNNDASSWVIGELLSRTITSQSALCTAFKTPPADPYVPDWTEQGDACTNGGKETTTRERTYYSDGLLKTETLRQADATFDLVTTYYYDDGAVRNLTNVHVEGIADVDGNRQSRETSYTYEPLEHQFVRTTTNAKLQTASLVYDRDFGEPVFAQAENGVVTRRVLDDFGQVVAEGRSGGDVVTMTRSRRSTPGGYPFGLVVENVSSTGARSADLFDRTGRLEGNVLAAPGGKEISEFRRYDWRGLPATVCEPAYTSGADLTTLVAPPSCDGTSTTYDWLGRPLTVSHKADEPDASGNWMATTIHTYDHLVGTVTDPLGHVTTTFTNGSGQVIATIDAGGGVSRKVYGAFGSLLYAVDDKKNAVWAHVDGWGRARAMHDPDLGARTYDYNAFGELIRSKDGAGRIVTFTVDELGRVVLRHDAAGDSTWTWDTASGAGVGLLASSAGPDGQGMSNEYDSFGRLTTRTLHRTAAEVGDAVDLVVTSAYDFAGRRQRLAYPSQYGAFEVQYDYGPTGLPVAVRQVAGGLAASTFWAANAFDERLRVTSESFGNGVTTSRQFHPASGRLKSVVTDAIDADTLDTVHAQDLGFRYDRAGLLWRRTDLTRKTGEGRQQEYAHDELNRLLKVYNCDASFTHVATELDVSYDTIGNITGKNGVGVYSYTGAWPHAVTLAGSTVMDYYANGNLKQRGDLMIPSYTTFNKPTEVETASGGRLASYRYDAEGQRAVKESPGIETILYADGIYELHRTAGGDTWAAYYVSAGGKKIALKVNGAIGAVAMLYIHPDQLGTVDVVTDEVGHVVDDRYYDAFGRLVERNTGLPDFVRIGFTGHEAEEELGLVNMTGRIYDPLIGRFTVPDPFVQAPGFSQSWNRYSYVLNSPLVLVDPSGFYWSPGDWVESHFEAIAIGTVLAGTAVLTVATGGFFAPVLAGEILGLSAAAAKGGDRSAGMVVGGFAGLGGTIGGAIVGPASGSMAAQVFHEAVLGGTQGGAIGAAAGYGGGAGSREDILRGALIGAAVGAVGGASKPLVMGRVNSEHPNIQDALRATGLPRNVTNRVTWRTGGLWQFLYKSFDPDIDGMTIGNTVNISTATDDLLVWHELYHTIQYQQGGISFFANYLYYSATVGYGANPYEIGAYEYAYSLAPAVFGAP